MFDNRHLLPDQQMRGAVQIYYKLYNLSTARLTLIKVFLKVMSGADSDRQLAKIEQMLPGLNNSVDMGLVQTLAWCAACVDVSRAHARLVRILWGCTPCAAFAVLVHAELCTA